MRIISTFLGAHDDQLAEGVKTVLAAFDTLVDDKPLVVGLTVGRVEGSDLDSVRATAVGEAIIARCAAHHRLNYPGGLVLVRGIQAVAGAKERVRQVLANAPPQCFVLLLAADAKVYDAAFKGLGVDLQSANANTQ